MKFVVYAVLLAAWGAVLAEEPIKRAEAQPNLEGEAARISYSLGYQIGGDFKRQQVEMEPAAVVQGIRDALSGAEPQVSSAEMNETLVRLKQKVVAEQKQRSVERELEEIAAGKKFLEENASKAGVVTTESGLQYKIIEPGTGRSPGPEEQVTVDYRGTLIRRHGVRQLA